MSIGKGGGGGRWEEDNNAIDDDDVLIEEEEDIKEVDAPVLNCFFFVDPSLLFFLLLAKVPLGILPSSSP